MSLERLHNESAMDYKYRVLVEKAKGELDASWKDINEALNLGLNPDTIRKGTFFLPEYDEYIKSKVDNTEIKEVYKYKESTELKSDGSIASDRLIEMSEEQQKDSDFILEAHGFNTDEFELISAKHSMWNVGGEGKTLFASKVSVKPKKNGINFDKLIEVMKENVKPVKVESPVETTNRLLTVPLVDLHFGINTFESYTDMLCEILDVINSKNWETTFLPIGNDLLHNNNFKGQTANGTQIEKVDMVKAWEDAFKFYSIILETALKNSKNVVAHYIAGNHDSDISWAFAKALEVKFPQVKWDNSPKNKKIFNWEKVALINLHGEKGMNRVAKTLITKYRDRIVNSKVIEIYSGHIHNQKVSDEYGIIMRSLPTNAIEDEWHEEQSFEGSVKTCQLFEYAPDKLKTIHHI